MLLSNFKLVDTLTDLMTETKVREICQTKMSPVSYGIQLYKWDRWRHTKTDDPENNSRTVEESLLFETKISGGKQKQEHLKIWYTIWLRWEGGNFSGAKFNISYWSVTELR